MKDNLNNELEEASRLLEEFEEIQELKKEFEEENKKENIKVNNFINTQIIEELKDLLPFVC